jgi:hypothetical protein
MKLWKSYWVLTFFCFIWVSAGLAEDYDLKSFLAKASSQETELSAKEKEELLNQIGGLVGRARHVREKLIQLILVGELDLRYQEGRLWMSKIAEDQTSIQTGIEQLKLLKENPMLLAASVSLYKSLRDLSSNLNAYNNIPAFSAIVGDLAPEMELWVDPVFYKLYLLPLAQFKDKEPEVKNLPKEKRPEEKKPGTKGKKL